MRTMTITEHDGGLAIEVAGVTFWMSRGEAFAFFDVLGSALIEHDFDQLTRILADL